MTKLTVLVNGIPFVLSPMADGQSYTLDIASAMLPGEENIVTLVGQGPEGASANVAIGDAPSDPPIAAVVVGGAPIALRAERSTEGLELSWPEEGVGLELQSRSGLGSGGAWVRRTESPSLLNGRYRVTVPVGGTGQLFRLHQP